MIMGVITEVEILLVEDNPGDVVLTREALHEAKIHNRLSVATDGVEAMAFLRKEREYKDAPRPDIILLDLNMPRKNGIEVLREIKADAALKTIPVVILTTSGADQDVLKAYEFSANCYVTKPVDLDQFVKVVHTIDEFWLSIVRLPPKP
jgi:chemotaxis family two-component system response regulator Rcp1